MSDKKLKKKNNYNSKIINIINNNLAPRKRKQKLKRKPKLKRLYRLSSGEMVEIPTKKFNLHSESSFIPQQNLPLIYENPRIPDNSNQIRDINERINLQSNEISNGINLLNKVLNSPLPESEPIKEYILKKKPIARGSTLTIREELKKEYKNLGGYDPIILNTTRKKL